MAPPELSIMPINTEEAAFTKKIPCIHNHNFLQAVPIEVCHNGWSPIFTGHFSTYFLQDGKTLSQTSIEKDSLHPVLTQLSLDVGRLQTNRIDLIGYQQ